MMEISNVFYPRPKNKEIIQFLAENNYGMTVTEVARKFNMRYYRAKIILKNMVEKKIIQKILMGNVYLYQKNTINYVATKNCNKSG
jgi:predicted transcriptional regulator